MIARVDGMGLQSERHMIRNDAVLVIVDPSARHHAGLAKAALLASKFEARVDLFASSGSAPAGPSRLADENRRVAETSAILQTLARPLRDRGLDVTTQVVHAGSLNCVLAEHLNSSCTRFVIKDVHQDAISGKAALTPNDWELAHACPASLLLSKSTLWPALPRICAAIDSKHGQESLAPRERVIMEQGALLTARLGGELDVLHACAQVLARVVGQLATSIVVMGAVSHNPLLNQLPCDVLLVKAQRAAFALH